MDSLPRFCQTGGGGDTVEGPRGTDSLVKHDLS